MTMPTQQPTMPDARALPLRREPRVLVGDDARRAAWVQRLFPVGCWKLAARDIARRVGRDAWKAQR